MCIDQREIKGVFKKKTKKPKFISSELKLNERIDVGNTHLYPVYINDTEDHHYALFDEQEIAAALKRASKYREESIPKTEYWVTKLIKAILI